MIDSRRRARVARVKPSWTRAASATCAMFKKHLGSSSLTVSAIGLGCWGMSGCYGAADETEAEATLLHALDRGINFFDTADSYGGGHNELLIGRVLKGLRREIVLATKTGF